MIAQHLFKYSLHMHALAGAGTARWLEAHGLSAVYAVMDSHLNDHSVQQLFIAILGKMACLPDIKDALMRSGALERICAMMRQAEGEPALQEHGANSLCAISKGQPSVKDYIAAKLDTLSPFALLAQSMRVHCDNAAMCKANAMALWSIAFKNTDLKASAGMNGAFLLLAQAMRVHRANAEVLPHLFIAACNLAVNHAPNQAQAHRAGIVRIALELLAHHMAAPQLVFSILNCLNALISGELEGQQANHTKFEASEGRRVLRQVIAEWGDNQRIAKLTNTIIESLDEKQEDVAAALKQQQADLKLSILEMEELAAGDPKQSLPSDAWTELVRTAELRVKHKKGRTTTLQQVTLYKHTIFFFERLKDSRKTALSDQYYIALLVDVMIDKKDPKVLTFGVRGPVQGKGSGSGAEVRIMCDGRVDAEEWLTTLQTLLPLKTGTMDAKTVFGTAMGTKLEPRLLSWQKGALFVFSEDKKAEKKDPKYRLVKVFAAAHTEVALPPKAPAASAASGFVLSDSRDAGRAFAYRYAPFEDLSSLIWKPMHDSFLPTNFGG